MSGGSDHQPVARTLWLAGLKALVGALVTTLAVRSAALAVFTVPVEFAPLAGPAPTIFFTTAGTVGAVATFGVIRRFSERPEHLFRRIALGVLLVSLVPDLWLLGDGAAASFPGATPAGVVTLMLMHVAAFAVIVWSLTAGQSR